MQNNLSVVVLDKNKNSREIIKAYLEELNFIKEICLFENYSQGFEKIKEQSGNVIVVMDCSEYSAEIRNVAENLRLYTSKIVITSTNYSTNTIVKALRLGAKEFLPKPVLKEDLHRIVSMFSSQENDSDMSESKIISVYSNKGGIGKTTLATNLAIELAKTTKERVALIDLNLQLGDISTFLNLNPSFDVSYVIKKLKNKDGKELLSAFEKYKNTSLFVLADPSYIEQSESVTPQQIEVLFTALKNFFPYVIVDMSSGIDPNTLKVLDSSDWILFTTIVNIPAIRNCQRCLNLFRSRRYPNDKVKVVINRYMENDEIKIEDIENTLGEKVYWKIPNNYFTIMDAINKGVGISEINANSNIANNFRDFASKVVDDIIEQSVIRYRL